MLAIGEALSELAKDVGDIDDMRGRSPAVGNFKCREIGAVDESFESFGCIAPADTVGARGKTAGKGRVAVGEECQVLEGVDVEVDCGVDNILVGSRGGA